MEIAGTKAAHIRDGAALTRFLHWVATEGQINPPDEVAAGVNGFGPSHAERREGGMPKRMPPSRRSE